MCTLANRPIFEPGEEKRLRADYAGNVTLIDDQIGEIFAAVEARGEMDNTVIMLCSDHGEMNGDCGILGKSNFMNGTVRVPMVVRTPETVGSSVAGKTCASHTEWFDAGPSLVELAGGEIEINRLRLFPIVGKTMCIPKRCHFFVAVEFRNFFIVVHIAFFPYHRRR